MFYTQKQVREELQIPPQTYRYWASCIPALAAKRGKAAQLTIGDVLALAFTKKLCDRFGLRVGAVAPALDNLFTSLNSRSWLGLDGAWLKITTTRAEFVRLADLRGWTSGTEEDSIFLECAPVLRDVRAGILALVPEQQLVLAFAPKLMDSGKS